MLSRRPVASCPMGPPLTIDELVVADPPEAWRAAGFEVEGDTCVTGSVRVLLEGARRGRGIVGWSVRGASTVELDGLPTTASENPPPTVAPEHPNGVIAIDHVVVFTPDLERTASALGDLLGEPREAVQPDRRIATLRQEAGLGPAIAFMTPGPGAITA
jgi:hypothetical protein